MTREQRRERARVNRSVKLISAALEQAKARTIRRINRQLARMSPNDVQALDRLLGKR
jgi:hypothetical protein